MKKTLVLTGILAIAFAAAGTAYAEEVTIEATTQNEKGETVKVPVRAQVQVIKAEIKDRRQDLKSEIESRKQELEAKKAGARAEIKVEKSGNASSTIAEKMQKT